MAFSSYNKSLSRSKDNLLANKDTELIVLRGEGGVTYFYRKMRPKDV